MLNDVMGKAIRSWDDRGHNQRTVYDALRRPTELHILGTDAANSDPRTLAAELCYEKTIYGEGQSGAETLNLNTRLPALRPIRYQRQYGTEPAHERGGSLRLQGQPPSQQQAARHGPKGAHRLVRGPRAL
jgi:hypothetical protein